MLSHATFLSPWYWVFAALFWGVICNTTFGAPNELLLRAARGGDDAALFERLARRNIILFAQRIRRRAPVAGALAAFVLALLVTVTARTGSEATLGVLVLFAPAALLSIWGGLTIVRMAERLPDAPGVRRIFFRARLYSGLTAAASMLGALGAAGLRHGAGWTDALFRWF
ncbi:MAG: hypothetical protein WD969_13300 [Paracoccaceae bacterium]